MKQMTQVAGSSASPRPTETPAAAGPRIGFGTLPLWARLLVSISIMLVVVWSVMIFLTYSARRDGSITQARNFAESVNQMTVATITAMMLTGVVKEREVFLEQIRNSNDVSDVKVFRFGTVLTQYGAGTTSEAAASAEEKAAMESGKPSFKLAGDDSSLQAIFPIVNSKSYLGKDCTGCHQGNEGTVLGAVSMRVCPGEVPLEPLTFVSTSSRLTYHANAPPVS